MEFGFILPFRGITSKFCTLNFLSKKRGGVNNLMIAEIPLLAGNEAGLVF